MDTYKNINSKTSKRLYPILMSSLNIHLKYNVKLEYNLWKSGLKNKVLLISSWAFCEVLLYINTHSCIKERNKPSDR